MSCVTFSSIVVPITNIIDIVSHTIQPGWQKFKPAEMRTYVMDEDGHLDETVESRGARSTAVLQNVSLSLTSASD